MVALSIVLYVVSALLGLYVAEEVLRRALKHGPTFGGLDALIRDFLVPRRAWTGFVLVASSVVLSAAGGIVSLFA